MFASSASSLFPTLPAKALTFLKLSFALLLLTLLAGCEKTLVDESGTVAGDSYWTKQISVSSKGKVSVDLSSAGPVDCYVMDESDFRGFQSAMQSRGMASFRYAANLSRENTRGYNASAMLPGGNWTFVVISAHPGMMSSAGTANFNIKIKGAMSVSVAGGYSPPPPTATPPPQIVQQPPTFTPQQPIQRPPQIVQPTPPPRQFKTTFATLDEAIATLQTGEQIEKSSAFSYLSTQNVVDAKRGPVVAALLSFLSDAASRSRATPLVIKWAGKNEAAALRQYLQSAAPADASNIDAITAHSALELAKHLVTLGDEQAVEFMVRLTRSNSAGTAARAAVEEQGSAGEKYVLALLPQIREARDSSQYMSLLGSIGTEKSIEPLQEASSANEPLVSRAATEALKKLAARLQLKPEQYLYNLFNKYAIEGPIGFTLDTSVNTPNTKQWTRQATGRAIKSIYTVQVTRIAKGAEPRWQDGGTIQAGPLTFKRLEAPAPRPSTLFAHVAAVDGEYLIDITATLDTADRNAQPNMNAVINKIRPK